MFAIYDRANRTFVNAPGRRVPELFETARVADTRLQKLRRQVEAKGADGSGLAVVEVGLIDAKREVALALPEGMTPYDFKRRANLLVLDEAGHIPDAGWSRGSSAG